MVSAAGVAARRSRAGREPVAWRRLGAADHPLSPEFVYPEALHAWPAHGHIDRLQEAGGMGIGSRGMGIGSRGMRHLMSKLRKAGAPGMHLQVSPKNRGALESQSGSLVK